MALSSVVWPQMPLVPLEFFLPSQWDPKRQNEKRGVKAGDKMKKDITSANENRREEGAILFALLRKIEKGRMCVAATSVSFLFEK
jgi:hypothetical protein